jgi:carbon monoxide dehydrogenase subunit G
MTVFKSTINVNRPVSEVYAFLSDFNNHQQLMPDDIQDWKSTTDEASFGIKSMAKLALKITERVEDKSIKILPTQKPPFDAGLNWALSSNGDTTEATFTLSADLNMMMKMMASGPLQKLADYQTKRLAIILR